MTTKQTNINRTTWKLSTFTNLRDTRPVEHTMTFHQLCKGFTSQYGQTFVHEKQHLPLWSPTIFNGTRRSGAAAAQIYFLVFDIDDGFTPFDTWRLFHEYHVIAHTSFSHKPNHHKYRIILPLLHPIPATDWNRASVAAKNVWNTIVAAGEPDSAALNDRARVYFRYGIPSPSSENMTSQHPLFPSNYHQTAWNVGRPFDLQYEHIVVKEPVKRKYMPKVYSNGKAAINEVMMDPQFRMAFASQCGANIEGNEARYITCPQCSRNSVHFSLDPSMPTTYKWPTCNHVNSCGWWGRFEELL